MRRLIVAAALAALVVPARPAAAAPGDVATTPPSAITPADTPASAAVPQPGEAGSTASSPAPSETAPAPTADEQGSWFSRMIDTLSDLPGAFARYVGDAIRALVAGLIRPVFDAVGKVVFTTPDLAASGQVLKLWGIGLAVTDLSLVVVILARAHGIAWGGIVESIRAKQGLEGLVLGLIGAHVSLGAVSVATKLSNALAGAFLSGVDEAKVTAERVLTFGTNPLDILLLLVALLMAVLVPLMAVVRIAVLGALAVVGGPANIAFGLPATEGLTRAWWRALFLLEAVPIAQAIVFTLGFGLFFGDSAVWAPGSLAWDFLQPLVLIVLLWLLLRIASGALRAAAAPLHGAHAGMRRTARLLVTAAMLGRVPGTAGLALRRVGVGAAAGTASGAARAASGRRAR